VTEVIKNKESYEPLSARLHIHRRSRVGRLVATASPRLIVATLLVVSIASPLFGFVVGWVGSRRLSISPNHELNRPYLTDRGDASGKVRTDVTRALRELQDGYTKRDPRQLSSFMQRLFPNDEHILICGTDPSEWIQGRESAQRFIGRDWTSWGDLRLAVDNAEISSLGDVAWLATTGTVSNRPIRFLAVLIHTNDRWLFRQIQFQWDDVRSIRLSDLLRPSVIVRMRLH
jgi:hypothetical protein